MELKRNIPLASYTSWMVGGPAEYFALPTTENEIKDLLLFAHQKNIPITVLGGGSNVLISDQGISGLVICLKNFSKISSEDLNDKNLIISCQSGVSKSELLKVFLKHKLAPALFLAGLPGDVGGGIVMNAGVSEQFEPREFGQLVDSFEVMKVNKVGHIEIKKYEHKDIVWRYRHTEGWTPGVITNVRLKWPLVEQPNVLESVRQANKIRLQKQPLDKPSCGSVFKNPEPHKAAQLIDKSGLKGFRLGDAQVSEKHANFIVNLGQASATDIWKVINHVQKTVQEKTQIKLVTEVIRLGNW